MQKAQQTEVYQQIDADRFFRLALLDESYLRALYTHLKLRIEHLDLDQQGEGSALAVRRVLHYRAERAMPRPLEKLLGGATLVKEHTTFDAARGEHSYTVELPVIGNRVDCGGLFRWTPPASGDRFERRWEGFCTAKIPLVGGKLERWVLDEMVRGTAESRAFTQRWIAER